MSARYFEAPDTYGDSCLWERRESGEPRCILSEYDIKDDYRARIWPLIVAAVVASS